MANLMKAITGSICLVYPFMMKQMGIIWGTILTVYIVYVYSTCAWRLLEVNKQFQKEKKNEKDSLYKLDNLYIVMCYHYFGKFGYWLTYWSILITLWGSAMGIMVIMTDYLTVLPVFSSISPNPRIARILPTIILVIVCWLLCLLKDSNLLVGVSALGLFALLFAVIVALVYGGIHWGIRWDSSLLYPESLMGILSNIGIIINAFGFLLCLFSLYVKIRKESRKYASRYINISLFILCVLYVGSGIILLLMFHQDPQGLQYTVLLNLPGNSFAYYAVAATMVLTLLGSFPLLLLPCFEILETNVRKYEMKE
ncbi:hypothetical protein JH06_2422 [Blastocystis sp. subtype 4]|uniref:hypothetical protein n=1 Tax=Blastocystis sp. subtype 4 TaxID=944170 RepID=UPI000711BBFE|nr:hypothetical protein JH06_2422 [Blastocystis sp. subtype 4]KNB45562.1 hypothetical protein JH06_2422 [Blastocystis sp. subtype 4]|eukprot:XP_014528993.1 hypothetical protein JH06_2422 [Blastocystis sp. subtype 4]